MYDLDLWGLHWHLKNTQSVREIQGRLKRPCDKDPTFMTHATTKDEKQWCVCLCARRDGHNQVEPSVCEVWWERPL